MGKKVDKSLSKERHSSAFTDETDRSSEPYKCNGNFLIDFNELCKQAKFSFIPAILYRPKLPVPQPVTSDIKIEKKGDKKQFTPAHEADLEADVHEAIIEGPPKTYTTKEKFQYFKPNIQVELDSQEKWETVTEVYIRGWKIDGVMMEVFRQCWTSLTKLHTINLWNTGLTEATLHFLATFLVQCSNLKNVILDGNSVKEENWSELLGENSIIQNLSLRFCNITDKGAARLAKALKPSKPSSSKLVSLNLSGNIIGDTGAVCLAESLRTNRILLSLNLASNNIGDVGAIKLSETISRIPLTHEEVVLRRTLLSERGPIERKSPLSSRRAESRERPASVSRSVTSQDKSSTKQKPTTKKKMQDLKLKDSKEEIKSPKKEKEDSKSKKAQATPSAATGRMSSASSSTDITKTQSKTKDKKKDRGKSSSTELDSSDSHEQTSPLLDTADYIQGQLWIPGNRALINLNLTRNKIDQPGIEALLEAVQYQAALKSENKYSPVGLMRLVINKNAAPAESECMKALTELMLLRDPFYKPNVSTEALVS